MRRIAAAAVLLALAGAAERTSAQADAVTTCVANGSELTSFRLAAGDTAAFQDSVRRAHPVPGPGYAGEQPWFTGNEPVNFRGARLNKYGRPRFIDAHLLRRVGEYQGIGVYAAETAWWRVDVFYLPVRAGCEFQPYSTPHWGMECSEFGCPFPQEPPAPGAVCVIRDGELVWTRETGDARPGGGSAGRLELAASRRWYAADRPLTFRGKQFVKTGLPRELPPGSVRRVAEVDGVGVYMAPGYDTGRIWGFYVPVRAGCEFQLYEDTEMFHEVRGD
jgi:hypothetical protein